MKKIIIGLLIFSALASCSKKETAVPNTCRTWTEERFESCSQTTIKWEDSDCTGNKFPYPSTNHDTIIYQLINPRRVITGNKETLPFKNLADTVKYMNNRNCDWDTTFIRYVITYIK